MIDRIRKIVNESSFLQEGTTIAIEDDLYAAGLTSHASVELMLQLEDEFNIEFPERLLKRSTFESIASLNDALCGLVQESANKSPVARSNYVNPTPALCSCDTRLICADMH